MTRTTELLKEIKKINTPAMDKIWSDGARVLTTLSTHKSELIKSELRGRLDALKEEVKDLREFQKILNNNCIYQIGDKLASIQEEIKLIEEKI